MLLLLGMRSSRRGGGGEEWAALGASNVDIDMLRQSGRKGQARPRATRGSMSQETHRPPVQSGFTPARRSGPAAAAAPLSPRIIQARTDRPAAPATIGLFRTGPHHRSLNVLVPGRALRYYLSRGRQRAAWYSGFPP